MMLHIFGDVSTAMDKLLRLAIAEKVNVRSMPPLVAGRQPLGNFGRECGN